MNTSRLLYNCDRTAVGEPFDKGWGVCGGNRKTSASGEAKVHPAPEERKTSKRADVASHEDPPVEAARRWGDGVHHNHDFI